MADSDKSSDLDAKQKGVPAWKLREQMKSESKPLGSGSNHSVKKMLRKSQQAAKMDPNLPPAFRAAFTRAAFAKQQKRRKNNDEFVSLNSSHPTPSSVALDPQDTEDDLSSFGGDSFGEVEEGDEEEEQDS